MKIDGDKKMTPEDVWWAKQFKVSQVPMVAFVSAGGKDVKTELCGSFSSDVLNADVQALSEGKELPYVMVDAFKEGRRLLEVPPPK